MHLHNIVEYTNTSILLLFCPWNLVVISLQSNNNYTEQRLKNKLTI